MNQINKQYVAHITSNITSNVYIANISFTELMSRRTKEKINASS